MWTEGQKKTQPIPHHLNDPSGRRRFGDDGKRYSPEWQGPSRHSSACRHLRTMVLLGMGDDGTVDVWTRRDRRGQRDGGHRRKFTGGATCDTL